MGVFGMGKRKTMLLSAPRLLRVWVLSAPKDAACEWLVGGRGKMRWLLSHTDLYRGGGSGLWGWRMSQNVIV